MAPYHPLLINNYHNRKGAILLTKLGTINMETKNNMKGLLPASGGADWKGERSFLVNKYHFCARCGSRRPISELEWQRGLLVCKKYHCQDKHPFIGEREAAVAHAIEVPTNELMPDDKLITPTGGDDATGDEIIF